MPRFIVSNKALADLKEIGRYTQEHWGREQRNIYLTMIDECFCQLAANPDKGKDCSHIRSSYRKYITGSHVIYYRKTIDNTVEIIRVLHGRMDVEKRLSG
ncbi:MAG: type II toxin-antitoxin system RelE/ParE family toxin [Nitrospirae bacterium]|nr:type II toxin-antitoxin system RelE/ParE family toxin [Nitrospirota bacterium]